MRIKTIIFRLSLLSLVSSGLWAQEVLDESSLNAPSKQEGISSVRESLVQNYQIDYARGAHFGINARGYGKGGFYITPAFEIWSDLFRWGFIAVGVSMNYHQLFMDILYRYTLPFVNYSLEEMGNSGVLRLGYSSLYGFKIQNEFEGGKIRTTRNLMTNSSADRYTARVGIQNHLSLTGLLYDDNYNRLELNAKGGYRLYTEVKESFWEAGGKLKYRNRHPWGEFGMAFFGFHADRIGDKPYGQMTLESGLNLWEDILEAPFIFKQSQPTLSYFNTVAAVNAEYRFYFLYPLMGGWRDFYFSAIGGIGFGFRHGDYSWTSDWVDNFKNHGIWWAGWAFGYTFNNSVTFQTGFLVNNDLSYLILFGLSILSFSE